MRPPHARLAVVINAQNYNHLAVTIRGLIINTAEEQL
jgi:hypothetical protein